MADLRSRLLPARGGWLRVVPAAAGVAAGRLEVAVLEGANPDVLPRLGNGEPLDPGDHLPVVDPHALRIAVREPATHPPACDPGGRVGDVAQPRKAGSLLGLGGGAH